MPSLSSSTKLGRLAHHVSSMLRTYERQLPTWLRRPEAIFVLGALLPTVWIVVNLLRIFASRTFVPVDLEWCEGGELLHAHRLVHGQEIYTPPNSGFLPYSYPPGHAIVLALVGSLFGVNFWAARVVSLLSFVGIVVLITQEIHRVFRGVPLRPAWTLTTVGLMCAVFPLAAGWFDLIRNDELVLFLVLLGGSLISNAEPVSNRRLLSAAAVLVLAAFTKQTAVFYVAWIGLFVLFRDPRRGLLLGASSLVLAGLTVLCLQWLTSGRYLYYTVWLLADQQVHEKMYNQAIQAWTTFAPYLTSLPAVAIIGVVFRLFDARTVYLFGLLAAAFPASMLPYAKQGGYLNNLMPVALLAGPVLLSSVGCLLRSMDDGRPAQAIRAVVAVAFGYYIHGLVFTFEPFGLTQQRRDNIASLYRELRALGPSFLMPHHPMVAVLAGSKLEQFHEMPWVDAWLAGVKDLNLRPFIERLRPEFIVMSGMEIPLTYAAMQGNYELHKLLPDDALVPPVTGFPSFPRMIFKRKAIPQECVFDFESGLISWKRSGRGLAVTNSTTREKPVLGRRDRYLSTGLHAPGETNQITSPRFELTGPKLSLLVGGAQSDKLHVELWIDDEMRARATGTGVDHLGPVEWNVEQWLGKSAQLRIVDRDPHGYLLVDDVCFSGHVQ